MKVSLLVEAGAKRGKLRGELVNPLAEPTA